jgi:hypothetical protein
VSSLNNLKDKVARWQGGKVARLVPLALVFEIF